MACCIQGTGCTLRSAAQCATAGGTSLVGLSCTPDPCTGACCNQFTGECAIVLEACCVAMGLQDLGYNTKCPAGQCHNAIPPGACCQGATCTLVVPETACAGSFLGYGSVCAPAVLGGTVNACCKADFNGDGQVTVQDLFSFLAAWFAGCP